jgi:hypothetical protein
MQVDSAKEGSPAPQEANAPARDFYSAEVGGRDAEKHSVQNTCESVKLTLAVWSVIDCCRAASGGTEAVHYGQATQ